MQVATMVVRLMVRQSRSLKDKRRVVKSLKERLRNKFNVSVAELEALDSRTQAVLGVAMVSNEKVHLESTMSQILNFIDQQSAADLVSQEIEFS